jgi:CTP:molybdopterin cytidylyltransferase MocA
MTLASAISRWHVDGQQKRRSELVVCVNTVSEVQSVAALSESDQAMVTRPQVQQGYLHTLQEALRYGPRGAQLDAALMVGPWEFRPQENTPAVHL